MALLSACGQATDAPHNLGNTADGDNVGHAPPPATASDFTGVWIGEAEDPLAVTEAGGPAIYRFPSGSTRIRIEYRLEGPRTITFGEGSPPAPPTDFERGYPTDKQYFVVGLFDSALLPPVEGFAYTLGAGGEEYRDSSTVWLPDESLQAGVVRFLYLQNEVFEAWCDGQVPRANPNGGYGCLDGWSRGFKFDESGTIPSCTYVPFANAIFEPSMPVDCGKLLLCAEAALPICECNDVACNIDRAIRPMLQLRRDGDELVGNVTQGLFSAGVGRLTALGTLRFHRE